MKADSYRQCQAAHIKNLGSSRLKVTLPIPAPSAADQIAMSPLSHCAIQLKSSNLKNRVRLLNFIDSLQPDHFGELSHRHLNALVLNDSAAQSSRGSNLAPS